MNKVVFRSVEKQIAEGSAKVNQSMGIGIPCLSVGQHDKIQLLWIVPWTVTGLAPIRPCVVLKAEQKLGKSQALLL